MTKETPASNKDTSLETIIREVLESDRDKQWTAREVKNRLQDALDMADLDDRIIENMLATMAQLHLITALGGGYDDDGETLPVTYR